MQRTLFYVRKPSKSAFCHSSSEEIRSTKSFSPSTFASVYEDFFMAFQAWEFYYCNSVTWLHLWQTEAHLRSYSCLHPAVFVWYHYIKSILKNYFQLFFFFKTRPMWIFNILPSPVLNLSIFKNSLKYEANAFILRSSFASMDHHLYFQ